MNRSGSAKLSASSTFWRTNEVGKAKQNGMKAIVKSHFIFEIAQDMFNLYLFVFGEMPLEGRKCWICLSESGLATSRYILFNYFIHFDSMLKFIYSEKATKFCEIFTVDLSYVVPVKSTVEISQNFVAFSEYVNFTKMNPIME